MKTAYPNRFFGSNPVSVPSQGRREEDWSEELPRTWRSALGLEEDSGDGGGAGAAQTTAWSGGQEASGA